MALCNKNVVFLQKQTHIRCRPRVKVEFGLDFIITSEQKRVHLLFYENVNRFKFVYISKVMNMYVQIKLCNL